MYFKCIEHYKEHKNICISMNKNINSGIIAKHYFYFDKDIKFINVPKCASTAIKQYKPTLTNKFVVIREPYSRLHSCFKHVLELENISMEDAISYLTNVKLIEDPQVANAMMHFIPASFFIECSKIFCNDPFDVFKLESLQFKQANINTVTKHDNIISDWISYNKEFIQNFYKEDIELYNANE
jgi:hypothetical protein